MLGRLLDNPLKLFLVLTAILILGIVGLGFAMEHYMDADCVESCEALNAEMVTRTEFGCICEGESGRTILRPPDHNNTYIYQ
jgi:hypothetical protein